MPCGNINPLGITGTPVIDPATAAIYLDAAVERPNGPRHEVFALSLKDGAVLPATGNTFGAATWSDGEAVFRVGADLRRSENKSDYFAPSDWKTLDARDADLGGSNPFAGAGGGQALMLALGKDRKAYLLDRKSLGGIGGQLAAETVSELQIITSPVTYPVGNDIFVAFQAPGAHCPPPGRRYQLTVLKIAAGAPPTMTTAWCGALRGRGSAIVATVIPIRLCGCLAPKETIGCTRSAAIPASRYLPASP
ncbi:hypothetical protein AYJ54_41285 [Bradyrhizobium centrolobii]|uniref:Uncharacterized protein n=1 Tax=Bradyrhizobium centrolobii TaxID=1505087 RepID=A0A176Z4U9_9BRAD|nr:hypothetical protein AYJ54_41285 [Bradyrhizobium centrolobii]